MNKSSSAPEEIEMPLVAIIGRPNVGKSTLFNRLAGSKRALVDNTPGVTRDLHYAEVRFEGRSFTLVDTGGIAMKSDEELKEEIRQQVMLALDLADSVILMTDGREGPTPDDFDVTEILRKRELPFYVAVNKIDGPSQEPLAAEFYSLGVEEVYPISAREKHGVGDLFRTVTADFPEEIVPDEDDLLEGKGIEARAKAPVRVAFVGKPNVGKSSMVNKILGEPRMIVSSKPGTTMDAIDIDCEIDGRKFVLIDTAGIRRKARVSQKIETFGVIKALLALDRCDVACLMIDANERLADQSLRIATYAMDRGCGLVFVLNKSDLTDSPNQALKRFEEFADFKIPHYSHIPRVHTSALSGKGVGKLFDAIGKVAESINKRIPTGELNRMVERSMARHRPVNRRGQSINVYYATQATVRPPTFVLFTSQKGGVHFSWERYLVNSLRKFYGFEGTPIRIWCRPRKKIDLDNPAVDPYDRPPRHSKRKER
jgi:GTPase